MQVSVREDNLEVHEVDTANVDEIASVDEDCSRGMKSNVCTSGFILPKRYIFTSIYKDPLSSVHNEKDRIYCIQIRSQGISFLRLV